MTPAPPLRSVRRPDCAKRVSGGRHTHIDARVAILVVIAMAASIIVLGTSAPQATAEEVPPPDPALRADDPRLAPELVDVVVDSPAYRDALGGTRAAQARLADARDRYARNQSQLGDLTAAEGRLAAEVNDAARRRDKSQRRLDALRSSLGEVAVQYYIRGGIGTPIETGLDLESVAAARRQQVLLEAIDQRQLDEVRTNHQIVDQADAVLDSAGATLADVRARLDEATTARDQAIDDGHGATSDLERLKGELDDARLEAQVVGLGTGEGSEAGIGFQLVALNAYVRATDVANLLQPSCALRWQTLAGIGRVETAHGTYLGRHLQADGQESEPIIGPPLDGSEQTAVITDTDGGELDRDTVHDRGVGPMAFIPTSWRAYGKDGNGDGVEDPQNAYDAVLASAGLVCRHAPLDAEEGLRRAFFSYNPSNAYVDMVLGFVHRYDKFELPPPPT